MHKIVFELCAETMAACLAARDGGADRIELCSALSEGGLTPSHAFLQAAIEHSQLPVHVLIRPRGGNFIYTGAELDIIAKDILHARQLGAAGVVFGLLQQDRRVDTEATRKLVALAAPMEVTFHRAFDATPSLPEALEDVIATGAHRVLTSGGHIDPLAAATSLSELVAQAKDRIIIAVGGGLRVENSASLAKLTGAHHFHGSLRSWSTDSSGNDDTDEVKESDAVPYVVEAETVRLVVGNLRQAHAALHR
jgi:copper homeostasis protein